MFESLHNWKLNTHTHTLCLFPLCVCVYFWVFAFSRLFCFCFGSNIFFSFHFECQPLTAVERTNQVRWVLFAFGLVTKGLLGSRRSGREDCGRTPRRHKFWDREARPSRRAVLAPSPTFLPFFRTIPFKNGLFISGGDCSSFKGQFPDITVLPFPYLLCEYAPRSLWGSQPDHLGYSLSAYLWCAPCGSSFQLKVPLDFFLGLP